MYLPVQVVSTCEPHTTPTPTHQDPYPSIGVWVSWGTGTGSPKKPQVYLWYSLGIWRPYIIILNNSWPLYANPICCRPSSLSLVTHLLPSFTDLCNNCNICLIIASAASNHWLRVKGPDKQIQTDARKWASGNFLNGLYLSKYLLPTLKILDLGGDW